MWKQRCTTKDEILEWPPFHLHTENNTFQEKEKTIPILLALLNAHISFYLHFASIQGKVNKINKDLPSEQSKSLLPAISGDGCSQKSIKTYYLKCLHRIIRQT